MNHEKGEIKMNPDTPLLIGMEEKIKDARINNIIKEPNENYWKMNCMIFNIRRYICCTCSMLRFLFFTIDCDIYSLFFWYDVI